MVIAHIFTYVVFPRWVVWNATTEIIQVLIHYQDIQIFNQDSLSYSKMLYKCHQLSSLIIINMIKTNQTTCTKCHQ